MRRDMRERRVNVATTARLIAMQPLVTYNCRVSSSKAASARFLSLEGVKMTDSRNEEENGVRLRGGEEGEEEEGRRGETG